MREEKRDYNAKYFKRIWISNFSCEEEYWSYGWQQKIGKTRNNVRWNHECSFLSGNPIL